MLAAALPVPSFVTTFSVLRLMWLLTAQNVVLISIASVMDASLAPRGKHTLHAYVPATEPWSLWEGTTLPLLALAVRNYWMVLVKTDMNCI